MEGRGGGGGGGGGGRRERRGGGIGAGAANRLFTASQLSNRQLKNAWNCKRQPKGSDMKEERREGEGEKRS